MLGKSQFNSLLSWCCVISDTFTVGLRIRQIISIIFDIVRQIIPMDGYILGCGIKLKGNSLILFVVLKLTKI